MTAEDDPDGFGMGALHLGDVDAELEAGSAPWDPHDAVAEALLGQRLPVCGGGEGDAGVGVEVVDVRRLDEGVHRRVDRRRSAPRTVPAEVERGDHLVLPVDSGVDVDEGAHPVEAQHGEPVRRERAEVAAAALHPQQLHRSGCRRIDVDALRRRVPAGVVGVAGVGSETVGAPDELVDDHRGVSGHRRLMLPSRRRRLRCARRRPGRSSPTGGTPRPGRDRARGSPEGRRATGGRRCCTHP